MQELNCRPPLGDDDQPIVWRSPHLFISSSTGIPRNPNVAPFLKVLYPRPRAVTGPKNLQPWCCSHFSASCPISNIKWCSIYCEPTSLPNQCLPMLLSKIAGPKFLHVERWVLVWVQATRACQMITWGERAGATALQQVREIWLLTFLRVLQNYSLRRHGFLGKQK